MDHIPAVAKCLFGRSGPLGSLALVGLGLATAVWQLMAISLLEGALFTAGIIVWGTLVHTHVPAGLLGRVTSLDWFVSTSLVPVSFALTGPIAAGIGVEATFVAGVQLYDDGKHTGAMPGRILRSQGRSAA